jgi:hypothetical protein
MIKSLRNAHRKIWITIAVLLPVGITVAWLVIPDVVPVKQLVRPKVELLPVIKTSKESDRYCINLRSNQEGTVWQLEWKNKVPLTVPSAVIYEVTGDISNISKMRFIGRIEARGDYAFPLPSGTNLEKSITFLLYDFIHEKTVDSIEFKHLL